MIKKHRTLSNITSLGIATIINSTLVFIVGVITRNILGPTQYGYWLTVSLVFTFFPLAQFGVLNAMNREIPFFLAKQESDRVEEIKEIAFSFIFTAPFLIFVLFFILSLVLFFQGIPHKLSLGLLLATIIAFLTHYSMYIETYYKSKQKFQKTSMLISLRSISKSIITVALVFLIGYYGLYLGLLFALLIQILYAKNIFPVIKIGFNIKKYIELIKIGFPILLVGVVWSIMVAADRIIVATLMTATDLGNYGVGMLVFSSVMLLPNVINQVFYPKIIELFSKQKIYEIKKLFWKINGLLAIFMLFILIIGWLLLPVFINLFMPEFVGGIRASQILLVGTLPLTLVGIAASYFNATNKQKAYLLIQFICILLNIILSIILLNINHSINSVALATSISFGIYMVLMNTHFYLTLTKDSRL